MATKRSTTKNPPSKQVGVKSVRTPASVKSKKTTSTPASTRVLKIGMKAPAFSMPSTAGGEVTLRSLLGKRFVLYFYPKDMTSGCTVEAHEFSRVASEFATRDTLVFGVSPDSITSHMKFIEKEGITFPLLADVDHAVAEKYGVWVEKSMYGKKYMGIERSTFVIGVDGKIEALYRKVKPEGHASCVLDDLGVK